MKKYDMKGIEKVLANCLDIASIAVELCDENHDEHIATRRHVLCRSTLLRLCVMCEKQQNAKSEFEFAEALLNAVLGIYKLYERWYDIEKVADGDIKSAFIASINANPLKVKDLGDTNIKGLAELLHITEDEVKSHAEEYLVIDENEEPVFKKEV